MKKQDISIKEILPTVGYGKLRFGMIQNQVIKLIGKPGIKIDPDEDGDIIFEYKNKGIIFLVFSKEEDFRLITIELINRSGGILWGVNIFEKKVSEVKKLIIQKGYSFEKKAPKPGNKDPFIQPQYYVKELRMSFFFDRKGSLTEILFGVPFSEKDEIIWPKNSC